MHKPLTFTERMELGKELAMVRRNRGIPVGTHESWRVKAPALEPDRSFGAAFLRAQREFTNRTGDALAQYRMECEGVDSIDPVPFFCFRERKWGWS